MQSSPLFSVGKEFNLNALIKIKQLQNHLGQQWIHKDLNLMIYPNEIIAIIGSSGCGKTTLLRSILMLLRPTAGDISVFDVNLMHCTEKQALQVKRRWGVMFQRSALFSALNVIENIAFPLRQFTQLSVSFAEQIAKLKLFMSGLDLSAAPKFPAELSGGMQKRVALARALVMDPELLFLDEPTAGLDPQSAGEFDQLILELRETLGLTVIMVTHDLDTLWRITDRVVFLGEGKVLAALPMLELVKEKHPLIQAYFSGGRSQARIRLAGNI